MNEVIQNKISADIKQNLLARVNTRMLELQMPHKVLSERTGIAVTNLSNIFKGRVGMSQLIKIAHAIGINVEADELEAQTGYWIKRQTEFKNYLLTKIQEGIENGISNQGRLIQYALNKFEMEIKPFEHTEKFYGEEERLKIREDSLKIITKLVLTSYAVRNKLDLVLTPVTVYRHIVGSRYVFSLSKAHDGTEPISTDEMTFMSFRKLYGSDYFYSEVIAGAFEAQKTQIVLDVIDAANNSVLWVNPYC